MEKALSLLTLVLILIIGVVYLEESSWFADGARPKWWLPHTAEGRFAQSAIEV